MGSTLKKVLPLFITEKRLEIVKKSPINIKSLFRIQALRLYQKQTQEVKQDEKQVD